jgi:hypothetical protein
VKALVKALGTEHMGLGGLGDGALGTEHKS